MPKQPMKKTSVNFPEETVSEIEWIAGMLGSTRAYAIRYAIRLAYGRLSQRQADQHLRVKLENTTCAGGDGCACGWHEE